MTGPVTDADVRRAAQAIAETFNETTGILATGDPEGTGSIADDWLKEARAALETVHPQTDDGAGAPPGNLAEPVAEATPTPAPSSLTLNQDEVAALLLPYISHVHDGWARQEAIKAASEVVALARPEHEVKAAVWAELRRAVISSHPYLDADVVDLRVTKAFAQRLDNAGGA